VIFVVFVVTTIVSMFILYRGVKLRQVRQEIRYFEKIDDLNSGLTLYLSSPETYQNSSSCVISLFKDTARKVDVSRVPYGILDMITAKTAYRGKQMSRTILAGMDPFGGDSVVLYVPDRRQALYASGNTIINGNAFLPVKGMQRASIEGKPLQRPNLILGEVSKSAEKLPTLAPWVREKIIQVQDMDSLASIAFGLGSLLEKYVGKQDYTNTSWYGYDGDYQISEVEVEGSVGFYSRGTIYIKSDAELKGILVSASKIIVEEGFRGTVQLFAKDSLVIGKRCELLFPSVACLYNDNVNPTYMEIGESAIIHGSLISIQENLSSSKPIMRIRRGALVNGQVYHSGEIELVGSIYGSLYCEGFRRKTNRAYYENHLLDNEINFHKLPKNFVSIDLLEGYNNQVIDVIDTDI
jgi:hypothetical protein